MVLDLERRSVDALPMTLQLCGVDGAGEGGQLLVCDGCQGLLRELRSDDLELALQLRVDAEGDRVGFLPVALASGLPDLLLLQSAPQVRRDRLDHVKLVTAFSPPESRCVGQSLFSPLSTRH